MHKSIMNRMMLGEPDNVKELRSCLNFKARVHISDGRVFIGTFVCTDKQKNIILAHTEEFRGREQRLVGLVMIPGKHLVKIETEDLDTI
ncbi:hypothetical protein BCR43DRAFT_499400 [Syncephalastrum racemosum]|uniref:Sm domain-containing protein n=1 Tax=Syncephalastrum racemosum TaxID=13706 RepID=A0A1X2H0A3_SYNRA|nr:hypothetical protein BCR43DRAFT_499400 [Syncephalastrum racemosum]